MVAAAEKSRTFGAYSRRLSLRACLDKFYPSDSSMVSPRPMRRALSRFASTARVYLCVDPSVEAICLASARDCVLRLMTILDSGLPGRPLRPWLRNLPRSALTAHSLGRRTPGRAEPL